MTKVKKRQWRVCETGTTSDNDDHGSCGDSGGTYNRDENQRKHYEVVYDRIPWNLDQDPSWRMRGWVEWWQNSQGKWMHVWRPALYYGKKGGRWRFIKWTETWRLVKPANK